MKIFKTNIAIVASFALAVWSVPAQSEVITYAFSGMIGSMFEHDHATNVNTTVGSSSFAGALVSLGDSVHGTFSYNTDAPQSPYYQPTPPATGTYLVYLPDSAVSHISFQVGSGSVRFQSGQTPIAIVGNDNSNGLGWDIFYLSASKAYDPVMFQDANIALYDKTGAAFSNGGMPTSLNLNMFHYKTLSAGWLRQADGDQMHFDVTLATLSPLVSSIPEPQTFALIILGLGMISFVTRRRADQY